MDNPNPTPPQANKIQPKAGKRTPITPDVAKALAQVGPSDVKAALAKARRENPILYALLIAIEDNA